MKTKFVVAIGLFCLLCWVTAPLAKADTFLDLTYQVSLNPGIGGVSDIIWLYASSHGAGIAIGSYYSVPAGTSAITVPKDVTPPFEFPEAILGIGVASGVPGDPGPALAVFGNFTTTQTGEGFATLFPGATESTVISDLQSGAPPGTYLSDIQALYNDALSDGLYILPGPSEDFDVVGFTNGQLIGDGTLTATVTPEPSTLVLLGIGLLGLGICRKQFA